MTEMILNGQLLAPEAVHGIEIVGQAALFPHTNPFPCGNYPAPYGIFNN
jgi:hypothetical protein